jgi:mycofactocin system FadH/OYE family oxidoreductase 1
MQLLRPVALGPRTAPNRVLFGPHVTNLGSDDRRLTARHVAYYERRARGGCGTIVVEGASVHDSDWPYERAPLAERCGDGWSDVVAACQPHGTLVIASLDHAGGQGSSAYSQRTLWAPSRVPEVNTREVPQWMEDDDITAVIEGFGAAARLAVQAGCDGVEVNAGQHSLVRQFLSGLTNQRDDEWGQDRLRFGREVITAVRRAAGADAVVGLRLSCDELAPWAGITPEMAPDIATALAAGGVDYLVVVRGSIFSAEKTRPDFHEPAGFNVELCRSVRAAVPEHVTVVLQGSVVDPEQAEWAVGDAVCEAVEMTRAQLADPDLVSKLAAGVPDQIRPCIRCNQTCQVRDARNPIVTCVVEPTSGHELDDPVWFAPASQPRDVLVVGAGPAGLELARTAALQGHRVRVLEATERIGGLAAVAGPGADLVAWLAGECERLGVDIELGRRVEADEVGSPAETGTVAVQCTGSQRGTRPFEVDGSAGETLVLDVVDVRAGSVALPEGDIVLFDPIGGPIAVALAEELGDRAVLVTQDQIAGNELARTGDLAPANVRLAQRGVQIERRSLVRSVRRAAEPGDPSSLAVELEDRFTGERRTITAAAVVDCGFRLPDDDWPGVALRAGDCVAPRTLLEAILEGRRAALAVGLQTTSSV